MENSRRPSEENIYLTPPWMEDEQQSCGVSPSVLKNDKLNNSYGNSEYTLIYSSTYGAYSDFLQELSYFLSTTVNCYLKALGVHVFVTGFRRAYKQRGLGRDYNRNRKSASKQATKIELLIKICFVCPSNLDYQDLDYLDFSIIWTFDYPDYLLKSHCTGF